MSDTQESIYAGHLPAMQAVMDEMLARIEQYRTEMKAKYGDADPVDHVLSWIKSEESMREKCRRRNLPENADSALHQLRDAIGIRIVCTFLRDVYTLRDFLEHFPDITVVEEKDYIRHAKPNGYRSFHLIVMTRGYYVEFQIRTISMDTWAALEHQMKYKKQIHGNQDLIVSELKRCADEMASTDISMQTIRDMIYGELSEDGSSYQLPEKRPAKSLTP